ncbi:MAG TPA: hypothetical protein VFG15_15825 [Amycolatopsis sp.]|nr:hypothetical protein [Amycolatopsis sp.]
MTSIVKSATTNASSGNSASPGGRIPISARVPRRSVSGTGSGMGSGTPGKREEDPEELARIFQRADEELPQFDVPRIDGLVTTNDSSRAARPR